MRNITLGATFSVLCSVAHKTAAAAGEHGDLLDLIAGARRLDNMHEILAEAHRFLNAPRSDPPRRQPPAPTGSPEAARRLFAMAVPIRGTLAECYLRCRRIIHLQNLPALRFHPHCFYRADDTAPYETWPALLAAVTDAAGTMTSIQRTWLARDGAGQARVATPRRAMGLLLQNGVRFGTAHDFLAAGEGIETVLSLRCVMPRLPMIAALSANHLAALELPPGLRRLYVARDNDDAGYRAAEVLSARAEASGIEALTLTPTADDFNATYACSAAMHWRVRCASSLCRRMSRLSYGVDRPGLDRRAASVSSAAPRLGSALPGQAPRGGLREDDRAGNGAAPQRRRGCSRRVATAHNLCGDRDRRGPFLLRSNDPR
jgi:Toprim domain